MIRDLIVGDGRDQAHRRPPALCGDYFQLNEMSFEQLVALAAEYARLVRFHQLDKTSDGDWHQYFSADEAILMAKVLAVDSERMLARFERRLRQETDYSAWAARDLRRPPYRGQLDDIDSPMLLARSLDGVMTAMRSFQGHTGHEMRRLLEGILLGLEREMMALSGASPLSPARRGAGAPSFTDLLQWGWDALAAKDGAVAMQNNFHTLTQALRMLQNGIRQRLPLSLLSGDHDPGVSLLIGFIELFQQLLQRLNRFGDKRIDFYYQQVLDMRPQPQIPDSAFLVIRPTAAARLIQIEAGAEFIGGVDEDQHDIIYAADRAATLNDARVVAVHSLFFDRDRTLGTLGCHQRRFEMVQPDSDERDHEKLPPMPLMGAPKPGEPLHCGVDAGFGFAIASKVLLMREGERRVRVRLRYRDPAGRGGHPIEACIRRLAEETGQDSRSRTSRESDIFVKLFRGMFRIALTTAEGWYQVREYRPEYSGLSVDKHAATRRDDQERAMPDDCLVLEFVLPAEAPATAGYLPALHGPGYDTLLPLLRFEMARNEFRYPYDILSSLVLRDIGIDVDVRGVRKLLLHNQIGQLSALAPFTPFGPLPEVGSYLIVGCEEILAKRLTDLSIDVEWAGLPTGLGGFAGHYRAYPTPLRSGDVYASLAVLADGKWIKPGVVAPVFGYVVNPDGSQSNLTSPVNRISFRKTMPFYKPSAAPPPDGTPYDYTTSSMNGLFKLTLDSPDGALGHQLYPGLLSQVLMHNAQQKKEFLLRPLPNPPYTPQIGAISLNYRASAAIYFEKSDTAAGQAETDSFIHLHPMGWQTMYASDTRLITQIPAYDAPGNLLIGVEGKSLRGTLSLYFYMRADSLPPGADPGLAWSYLSDNRWLPLEPHRILEDSTKGFMTSGIVLLQLPDDIDTGNTLMPSGTFWLRVTAKEGVECFCSLYAIYAQAIKVTWRADRGKKPQAVMPAMRITRSSKNIPGVDSIYQIRRSFGGKAAESALQFRVRASERLRHKKRALTAADFELMILERFPQVYKVKCFANLRLKEDPARRVRPGHILIVAIPYLTHDGHANQRPTLSGHLIQEIGQFIRQHALPDAVISVENPVYEEVQVRCTIDIKPAFKLNTGRLIEQVNQALCEYLSPWNASGIHQHFGWTLRQHDVVSFLKDLDYVADVTGVSLLQIAPTGGKAGRRYTLQDNAAQNKPGDKTIRPSYPWSIAVPMNQHWILLKDIVEPQDGVAIGVDELEIGSTFVISSRKPS